MRTWQLMGHYNGESQTYEALSGGFQTSPFTPPVNGRLKGIRVITGGEAATSLVEGIQFRLSSVSFTPNVIHVVAQGNGLQTVPKTPPTVFDYEVDQPVNTGAPIAIEARHNVATAVTCQAFILGLFEYQV